MPSDATEGHRDSGAEHLHTARIPGRASTAAASHPRPAHCRAWRPVARLCREGGGDRSCGGGGDGRVLEPARGSAGFGELVLPVRSGGDPASCHGDRGPAACQGLSQLEVNGAVGRALRAAVSGVRGKARQRQLVARDSPYLAELIHAVPAPASLGGGPAVRPAQPGRAQPGGAGGLAGHRRPGSVDDGPVDHPHPAARRAAGPRARAGTELQPLRAGPHRPAGLDQLPGHRRDRLGLGRLRAADPGGRPGHDPGVPRPGPQPGHLPAHRPRRARQFGPGDHGGRRPAWG